MLLLPRHKATSPRNNIFCTNSIYYYYFTTVHNCCQGHKCNSIFVKLWQHFLRNVMALSFGTRITSLQINTLLCLSFVMGNLHDGFSKQTYNHYAYWQLTIKTRSIFWAYEMEKKIAYLVLLCCNQSVLQQYLLWILCGIIIFWYILCRKNSYWHSQNYMQYKVLDLYSSKT